MVTDAAKGMVSVDDGEITGLTLSSGLSKNMNVSLALRPESVRRDKRKGDATLTGKVKSVDFLGSVMRTKVEAAGAVIAFDAFNDPSLPPPKQGDQMAIHFAPESVLVLGA